MSPQTINKLAVTDQSLDPLFDEAIDAIQSTLFEEDRKSFRHYADMESMLVDVRTTIDAAGEHEMNSKTCTKHVARFAHAFKPYFDLVNLFTNVRPDWLGWFWGIIALVFRTGSRYELLVQKIAELFGSIARALPEYDVLLKSVWQQSHAPTDDRLTLLSHVYADIVRLCLELYCMFSRSQGAKLRHRYDFASAAWKPLDTRFTHLQQRLVRHRRWVEATLAQDEEASARNRQKYIDVLFPNVRTNSDATAEADRMARRIRRLDKVKGWLSSCCAYRDTYEQSLNSSHSGSGSWFLNIPEYCRWKNTPFNETNANSTDHLSETWLGRLLFVQAKAGFGKTFISGRVISDLKTDAEDINIGAEPPTTIYFHFNAAHLYCTHPNDAFRALATQLVNIHQNDRPTLDALSLLIRTASFQDQASSDDVLSVLSLLVRQHPTFICLDGVDECSDINLLFESLPKICRKSDARVILFSRPTITLPLEYQEWASGLPHVITLGDAHNAADIDSYITENLTRLADQGLFGTSLEQSLIAKVSQHADGLFLWASLFLKFLQSPSLSPEERRMTLDHIENFKGLDPLYHNILQVLSRQNDRDRRVAADIFRWLALSFKQLCVPGFQTALTMVGSKDKVISDLADAVPQLTCGLVEVTPSSVMFIHRSVKEFLQSPHCQDSEFSLHDEDTVHGHLAARCLAFLTNEVPKRPLQRLQPYIRPRPILTQSNQSVRTGSSRDSGYKSMSSDNDGPSASVPQSPNMQGLGADLPFLRYSSLCWPIHLTRAFARPARHNTDKASSNMTWLPALSHFLTDRVAVTTWAEASWRHSLPPNLSRLIPLLSAIKSELLPSTMEGREIRWVIQGLRELSEAMSELREEYGVTLRENPSLIWQWSGTDGNRGFWPLWDEARGCIVGEERGD
ncbi:hypothetical protein BU24DRAFT_166726 [Aaosphaeria arxii CBS 175.79]|uniref:NACHT domain-containing protein n=1 Tax=Aaosphaeria arxii CBS 175.79 TaxID=1450172 RepID=A0A6A5XY01_9PLEO|nr:uncharacterized protein BU24DRAFT_166726 [Aaosphaeria arxii CBS 175.79]KAF2018188.1 hypothetical protein BU24DRAFT_166726 [Aaosphaeria arxii CBS 175.79]